MVKIEHENDSLIPCEKCCICRKVTPFWTKLEDRTPGQQVALCALCAEHAEAGDIPTKMVWLRRERIAEYNPLVPRPLSSPQTFAGGKS